MLRKIFVLTFMAVALNVAAQDEPKRVLFIGNSYTEVNNLPSLVKNVAESAGKRIEYQSNTPGGCTFAQHCANRSMDLIRQGGWDVVVLQEQSQLPSFPQVQVERECLPYAAQLAQTVYESNPDGEAMFYMTWGRENGDPDNARYFPVLGTYEGMDSMLYERYLYMARANDASVCPVGRVWRYLRANNPDIQLYGGDGSHPSMAGSYAAACAFYTMIFHDTPLSIRYTADLDTMVAATIRNAVQHVVYDTLSFWLRQTADTVQHDTVQHDTIQHDTTYTDTTQVAISSVERGSDFLLWPNPARHQLVVRLAAPAGNAEAEVRDVTGRQILRRHWQQGETVRLDISGLPQGIYFMTVRSSNGFKTKRFVIQ